MAETDPDLVEWDYGEYEGLTSAQILRERPDWQLFRDGAPTAPWLGLGPGTGGRYFLLSPASLSALSYEHSVSHPVIRLWNDDHHVARESIQSFGEEFAALNVGKADGR